MAITINDIRLSYCNLFQPKAPMNNPTGEPKYSVTLLIPKTNKAALEAIQKAINEAVDAGVQSKWSGVRPPQPAVPIHDGDGVRPSDGMPFGEECKGMMVMAASSKQAPFVVDRQVQPIIDPTQVYSGMWANVSITLFPYLNADKKGVGCGLNGVQKVRDDTPFGSRVTAQEAFSAMPDEAPAVNLLNIFGLG